jgi:hypothetical protein
MTARRVRSLPTGPRSLAWPSPRTPSRAGLRQHATAQQPARDVRAPVAKEKDEMSILGSLMGKILGHDARGSEANANAGRPAAPAAPAAPAPTPASAPAPTATAAPPVVDVETVLETMAGGTKQTLDWRHSIVDLMKLVGIDSSLANRKQLAQELGYTGDMNDSATMNTWLHKEVLRKLSENGGQVPANLLD